MRSRPLACMCSPQRPIASSPQVSRPCAPEGARWPTRGGVWAFEVIVPVAIAIEQRTCIQCRTHLEVGEVPRLQPAAVRARQLAKGRALYSGVTTLDPDVYDPDVIDDEWELPNGETPELDLRSYV